MARPAKAVSTLSKKLSKEDAAAREAAEAKISTGEPPTPPDYLTDAQREIFETVCTDLKESSILCSIDNYVLANFAIAVDRLHEVDHHGLILPSAIPAARSDSPAKRAEASARLYT